MFLSAVVGFQVDFACLEVVMFERSVLLRLTSREVPNHYPVKRGEVHT